MAPLSVDARGAAYAHEDDVAWPQAAAPNGALPARSPIGQVPPRVEPPAGQRAPAIPRSPAVSATPALQSPPPQAQVQGILQGQEPWLPNVVDLQGSPTSARSALRDAPGERLPTTTTTTPISGSGLSAGPLASSLLGAGSTLRRLPDDGSPGSRLPGDPGFNPFEVFVYRSQGLGSDGRAALQRALGIDPNGPGAKEALANLEAIARPYQRTVSEGFATRQLIHPIGFYPGDPSAEGRAWQNQNRIDDTSTPDLEERRTGGDVDGQSQGYVQTYVTLNPRNLDGNRTLAGASRYIISRADHLYYGTKIQTVEDNVQNTTLLGAGYNFSQLQARVGVSLQTGRRPGVNGGLTVDTGMYSEAGLNGFSGFKSDVPVASDWWLTNGRARNNLEDPTQASRAQEFASLRQYGYEFKGESLLPALGDNTAHVFMRVPNANVNLGNTTPGQSQDVIAIPPDARQGEYVAAPDGSVRQNPIAQGTEYRAPTELRSDKNFVDWARRHLLLGQRDQYISVDNTAALMTQLASRAPRNIELAYVTPQQLARNNADKLYTIVDPTTGQQTQAFKVGDWIDTSLLQVEGHPGLYIDRENLDSSLLNAQGQLQLKTDLPHWRQHLSPQGQPSLTTPRVLQRKSEFADTVTQGLTPSNQDGAQSYFESTRDLANDINARAGRELVSLSRPRQAAVFPGRPFSGAPQPQNYRNAEQYADDLQSYLTSIRDVYREADRSGVMLTDPHTGQTYSPRVHVDAAQADLDDLAANRSRIVDAIASTAQLREQAADPVRDGTPAPDNALPNDAYPMR
jgi:hypothetical protein